MSAELLLGRDKVRYLCYVNGRWRWRPTPKMRAAGFKDVHLGRGVNIDGKPAPAPEDIAAAAALNLNWDRLRQGLPPVETSHLSYPPGSIGDGYERAMKLRADARKAKGITWTTEQHSRDDWPRAWKHIEPLLGDCDPKTVTPEVLLDLRILVAQKVSQSEAFRVIKVWRSLWQQMALFGLCDGARDPGLAQPPPRQAVWREGEAVRLVKTACRSGYHGLPACMAVAWDSQLSPVDARSLKGGQLHRDPVGVYFTVDRAKTGRRALATLSRRAERVLMAYMKTLPELMADAAIFRNRSGRPYSMTSGIFERCCSALQRPDSWRTFAGPGRLRPWRAASTPRLCPTRWRTHCRNRTFFTTHMRRFNSFAFARLTLC